jgi:hypothetical protein
MPAVCMNSWENDKIEIHLFCDYYLFYIFKSSTLVGGFELF